MSVLLLASATGAPGVTTTALGLALSWPGDVLLADCDRDPAQVVQAGYLRGVDLSGRGLLALSFARREGRPLAPELLQQSAALSEKDEVSRRYLPGFTHPGSPALFSPLWGELAEAFLELGAGGCDVIVDCGRIGGDGLPGGLLEVADLVLVCVRSSLRSLAALRLHLPTLGEAVAACQGELGLIVVGEGQPYSVKEISKQFGYPVLISVAFEPESAAVLSDGCPEPTRFGSSGLVRSLRAGAGILFGRPASGGGRRTRTRS